MKVINKSLEIMKKKKTHYSIHISIETGKLLKLILKIFKHVHPCILGIKNKSIG